MRNRLPVYHDPEDNPENKKAFQHAERIQDKEREGETKAKLSQFGICWNCSHLTYVLTKYGKETAVCRGYERPDRVLSAADPVIECTDHNNKFEMGLNAMWAIATLIDADKPRVAGFITEEEDNGLEKDKALQTE